MSDFLIAWHLRTAQIDAPSRPSHDYGGYFCEAHLSTIYTMLTTERLNFPRRKQRGLAAIFTPKIFNPIDQHDCGARHPEIVAIPGGGGVI
jgi:hypothetical protein